MHIPLRLMGAGCPRAHRTRAGLLRHPPHAQEPTPAVGHDDTAPTTDGKPRSTMPGYLAASDGRLSRIDPILTGHQLTDGTGTLIAHQVENE